jgi:hypothetical protein
MVLLCLGICSGDNTEDDDDSVDGDRFGLFNSGDGDSDCWDGLNTSEEGSIFEGTGDSRDDGGLRSLTTGFTALHV